MSKNKVATDFDMVDFQKLVTYIVIPQVHVGYGEICSEPNVSAMPLSLTHGPVK